MHRCFFAVTSLLTLALSSKQNLPEAASISVVDDSEQRNISDSLPPGPPAACHLEDLVVNVSDITFGSRSHVLYPSKLNIRQCVGTCSKELKSYSNHYQYLLMRSGNYQGSCCVPTRFSPVTLIASFQGQIQLINTQAKVEECGCY